MMNRAERAKYAASLLAMAAVTAILPLLLTIGYFSGMRYAFFLSSGLPVKILGLLYQVGSAALSGVSFGIVLLAAAEYSFVFCLPFAAIPFFCGFVTQLFFWVAVILHQNSKLFVSEGFASLTSLILTAGIPLLGVLLLKLLVRKNVRLIVAGVITSAVVLPLRQAITLLVSVLSVSLLPFSQPGLSLVRMNAMSLLEFFTAAAVSAIFFAAVQPNLNKIFSRKPD